jgi:HK97 family phage prohead protease
MTALHQRRAEAPAQLAVTTRLLGADGQPVDIRAAAAADRGVFEGYAMLWDTTDAYGTRFAPGSFGAGGLDGGLYALLVMHDPNRAAGTFTAREDDRGLWIAGGWDDTSEGKDARARAKTGSADGLSVGFVPLMLDPDDEARFTQARLVEVSQITARMAAVPGAGFASARSALPHGVPGQEVTDPAHVAAAAAARAALAATLLR